MEAPPPDLSSLQKKLDYEEVVYARFLAEIDRLAAFSLPAEIHPEGAELAAKLNTLWESLPRPRKRGLASAVGQKAYDVVAPSLQRQAEFNATLVQLLNGHLEETGKLHGRLREVLSALVRYLQRVLPVVDARDRVSSALATTRSELILEAFDRRLESLARRLEGLLALRDRIEAMGEELRAVSGALRATAPPPEVAETALRAASDSVYTAFENRFRGDRQEIRDRLLPYAAMFEELAPVVDLGCGRGEFLEVLQERSIAARGVESNAHAVRECRDKSLDVVEGDLLDFLAAQSASSLGGVFAAQVAEHLPPRKLQALLDGAHRALRSGGLLVLETVNVRSVTAFLEVYNRDLTHERPLHSDTLSFLATAAGFTDVRVEMKSPVEPLARLQPVPTEGLPERTAQALNENVERLNQLLYAPLEYALIARR